MTIGLTLKELLELPPPEIIEVLDADTYVNTMVDQLKIAMPDIADTLDLESEPLRKLIQVFGYRETIIRGRVNDAHKANLLAYAQGSDLDQLGAFYDLTRIPNEADARFRERIVLAIAGRSTGGTGPRYRSIAMEADLNVAGAMAYTLDNDPTVYVSIYSAVNEGVASQEMIDAVTAALTHEDVRMVNDTIKVVPAVSEVQDITLNVWFLPSAKASLQDDLPNIIKNTWNNENGLGMDLVHSWITRVAMQPGVMRIEIAEPSSEHIKVQPYKSLSIGEVTINNMGVDQ